MFTISVTTQFYSLSYSVPKISKNKPKMELCSEVYFSLKIEKYYNLYIIQYNHHTTPHHTTPVLRPFFQNHPGEPVPKENFWTLWCKGRLTEGRHTDHPAGRHSIQTNQSPVQYNNVTNRSLLMNKVKQGPV